MKRVLGCALSLALLLPCAAAFAQDASKAKFPAVADLPSVKELPDPFTFFDGKTKVETKEDWLNKRRPELKELFQYFRVHRRRDRSLIEARQGERAAQE